MQVAAQVEHLHGSAICTVHLQVGDHSSACCSQLCGFAFPSNLRSQSKQLVDALFRFPCARWLTFTNVFTEVPVRHGLRALRHASSLFQIILLLDAPLLLTARLMSLFQNREAIIGLYVIRENKKDKHNNSSRREAFGGTSAYSI